MPPGAGSSVMITVDAPGGSSAEPSQPQVKTTLRPGSISVNVPPAAWPGMMVQRNSPPARRSTLAVTACQRRSRSGLVIRAKASSASSGMNTEFSYGITRLLGGGSPG